MYFRDIKKCALTSKAHSRNVPYLLPHNSFRYEEIKVHLRIVVPRIGMSIELCGINSLALFEKNVNGFFQSLIFMSFHLKLYGTIRARIIDSINLSAPTYILFSAKSAQCWLSLKRKLRIILPKVDKKITISSTKQGFTTLRAKVVNPFYIYFLLHHHKKEDSLLAIAP